MSLCPSTFRILILPVALVALALTAARPAAAEESAVPIRIEPGERIVLLGGGLVERMRQHEFFETMLTSRVTESGVIVRNLGWSGDDVRGTARAVFGTAEDGFKRLLGDVRLANPTLIFICYGNNEAHAGPAGLASFHEDLSRLLDELAKTGARLVLVSPHPYETKGPPFPDPQAYNTQVRLYSALLRDMAAQRSLAFVDLSDLDVRGWTRDGVQLTSAGYWQFSNQLAERIGYGNPPWKIDLDISTRTYDAINAAVQNLSVDSHEIRVSILDRFLPAPALPDERLNDRPEFGTLRVTGLAAGRYQILVDKLPLQVATADQLASGLRLRGRGGMEQVERLRGRIGDKNQLFFYRHRPQNETYLFLFRKHEQGNNAVEIPQFEPLIAEMETQIALRKHPQVHEYHLVRVGD